jgi:alternate signal-mediated exported protein
MENKKQNGKKTNKEKRVLIGALCVAAVMIAGSTFAWFTSKDEVTNRLSASAEYNVAVAETFQPPENWVPGQEINKDAAAVNTGNVDAFARMWLTGSMRLMKQSKTAANANAKYDTSASFGTITSALTDVADVNLTNLSLTKQDANGNYFKTLDKSQTFNPNASVSTNNSGYAIGANGPYSEVQAMQSGILAYAPSGAKYSYVLAEETELEIKLTSTVNGETTPSTDYRKIQVPKGTLVVVDSDTNCKASTIDTDGKLAPNTDQVTITSSSGSTKTYDKVVYVKTQASTDTPFFVPQNIEFESFTPMTDGLYMFLRNENDADQADPEFSGYYVSGITGQTPAAGTYYALNTGTQDATTPVTYRSDYTVKGAESGNTAYTAPVQVTYDNGTGTAKKNIVAVQPTANLELYTAKYDTIDATKLKFYAAAADTSAHTQKLYAVYDDAKDTAFDKDKDIIVEIDLANVGTDSQQWTGIGGTALTANYTDGATNLATIDASKLTFYYTDDIEAGDSSEKLVDKVKLYDGVTQNAYLAFDFDLNVNLESIQVTMDEDGNEAATAVANGWAATGTVNTGAKGTQEPATPSGEITKMTWADIT